MPRSVPFVVADLIVACLWTEFVLHAKSHQLAKLAFVSSSFNTAAKKHARDAQIAQAAVIQSGGHSRYKDPMSNPLIDLETFLISVALQWRNDPNVQQLLESMWPKHSRRITALVSLKEFNTSTPAFFREVDNNDFLSATGARLASIPKPVFFLRNVTWVRAQPNKTSVFGAVFAIVSGDGLLWFRDQIRKPGRYSVNFISPTCTLGTTLLK